MDSPWFLGIVSGLISGLITGTLTCGVFYWLAGRDLEQEASDLRQLNRLTISALVQVGLAEVNRDAQGNPVGLRYRLDAGRGTVRLSGSLVDLTVNPPPPGQSREPPMSP
jgi:hypothetical protein